MAQKVFPGAIVHHFSIFDTSRLWEKGRLCFLYTIYVRILTCDLSPQTWWDVEDVVVAQL